MIAALPATIVLFLARRLAPGRHDLELDIYVLVLGLFALLAVMALLREVAPLEWRSELEEALVHEHADPPRIAELDRLQREVSMGASFAFDLHFRLRPIFREIAAARLERRGLDLDSGGDQVRELLGEEVWEVVRPDREPPSHRHGEGPGPAEVEKAVERLEAL
jgi:hypothetical protein